jgi:anti-anti-sigma factor
MSLVIEEPPFAVDVAWCSNTATVSISGEVDLATVAELDECLLDVVTKRPDHIVVDLAGLRFIDCSGAAVLGRARAALSSAGGTMSLRSPNRLVRLVLRLTELDSSCQVVT